MRITPATYLLRGLCRLLPEPCANNIADALLGAAAAGDLGSVFGADRPEWKDAPGEALVRHVRDLTDHPAIHNVDVTILALRPKVAEFREVMRANIAALLGTEPARVSVKASSGNGLTDFGRGEGVAATVLVLVGEAAPA